MNSISYSQLISGFNQNVSVPDFHGGETNLESALAYQKCGWWIVPVAPGTKNPGSILGRNWPILSSNDPSDALRWFSNNREIGIGLHTGRSRAFVFDVDSEGSLPNYLRNLLGTSSAPYQSTRNELGRGHYVFSLPAGKDFTCSTAGLGSEWGEIRAGNTVIMAYPSRHKDEKDGARYLWQSHGQAPTLPETLEPKLRARNWTSGGLQAVENLDEDALRHTLEGLSESSAPELLNVRIEQSLPKFRRGSRHDALKLFLFLGFKDARAGLYTGLSLAEAALNIFLQFKPREEWSSANEFWDLLKWTASASAAFSSEELEITRHAGLAMVSPGVRAWIEVMSRD